MILPAKVVHHIDSECKTKKVFCDGKTFLEKVINKKGGFLFCYFNLLFISGLVILRG